MNLNSEQQTKLERISEVAAEIEKAHADARKVLAMGLNRVGDKLKAAVKDAADAGVPKRQIQKVSGVTSTGAFYELLREAGVTIGERPLAHLPKIRGL